MLSLVAWQSFAVVERLAALGQVSMAGGIPMTIPHAAVLVGFGLGVLACLATAVRGLLALQADSPRAEGDAR